MARGCLVFQTVRAQTPSLKGFWIWKGPERPIWSEHNLQLHLENVRS